MRDGRLLVGMLAVLATTACDKLMKRGDGAGAAASASAATAKNAGAPASASASAASAATASAPPPGGKVGDVPAWAPEKGPPNAR